MASVADRFVRLDHSLFDKPEVLFMRAENGWDAHQIAGALALWFVHVSRIQEPILPLTSTAVVDQIAGLEGFGDAMSKVGWIVFTDDGSCEIVEFDKQFSFASNQKAMHRERGRAIRASDDGAGPCANAQKTCATAHQTRQDKTRREETTTAEAPPCSGGSVAAVSSSPGSGGEGSGRWLAHFRDGLKITDPAALAKAADAPDDCPRMAWIAAEAPGKNKPAGWALTAITKNWEPPPASAKGQKRAASRLRWSAAWDAMLRLPPDEREGIRQACVSAGCGWFGRDPPASPTDPQLATVSVAMTDRDTPRRETA